MVLVKYKLFWLISLPWDASTDLWFSFYGLWCSMVWEAIKALIRKNDKIPLIPKSNLWAAKQAFTQKKGTNSNILKPNKNQKELIYRYFLKNKYTHIFELKKKLIKKI